MALKNDELLPGEKVVLSEHPHWWYFWKQVAAGVGVVLLAVLWATVDTDWLATLFGWLAAIGFVVWLADTIYQFVQWRTTSFTVTNQRVAYQAGVVRRSGVSIPLNRINNVNFDQGLIARMLNNGIVTIESAGETGDSVFENIPDPQKVRALIFGQMQADEQSDSNRDAAAIADALKEQGLSGGGGSSVQQRLDDLEQLRDRGLVSDDEFEIKRKQILEDL